MLRRVVWTLDHLYISRPAEEIVIDSIQFSDVDKVDVSDKFEMKESRIFRNSVEMDKVSFEMPRSEFGNHQDDKKHKSSHSQVFPDFEKKEGVTLENESVLEMSTIHDGLNSGCFFALQSQSVQRIRLILADSVMFPCVCVCQAETIISGCAPPGAAATWRRTLRGVRSRRADVQTASPASSATRSERAWCISPCPSNASSHSSFSL